MRIVCVNIQNFRGISQARILLNGHSVIIGDNNAGKSTVLEAIDLVLGPDRSSRIPVVDEHDFFDGKYYIEGEDNPRICIEVTVAGLSDEQTARFRNHLEFWDNNSHQLLPPGQLNQTDLPHVLQVLRVKFIGSYDTEDDDFTGGTFFCSPGEDDALGTFSKTDKRECGFLYLRALRTGARALSMERGSLLDIILRLRELRPKMWEDILKQLRGTQVATDASLGVTEILTGVQEALKNFVPTDWGAQPVLRVSDLTREHLRKTLTIFMSTGENTYHAPFQHQGTGTINTMVLALLSMIAEVKKNVIFAMEEPEIAIPPYTQKRIIQSIRNKSAQAIFTSHSPFVLEEFVPEQIILIQRNGRGVVNSQAIHLPKIIKPKAYHFEFRKRFCESLLAKRVLLTEGATEAGAYVTAARMLSELADGQFTSMEAMGISIFDAETESSVPIFGTYFGSLGKKVFAVFDKQTQENLQKINECISHAYESSYAGLEDLLIQEIPQNVLQSFYDDLIIEQLWPTHLDRFKVKTVGSLNELKQAVFEYLRHAKGAKGAVELLGYCKTVNDFPSTIRQVLQNIKCEMDTE